MEEGSFETDFKGGMAERREVAHSYSIFIFSIIIKYDLVWDTIFRAMLLDSNPTYMLSCCVILDKLLSLSVSMSLSIK